MGEDSSDEQGMANIPTLVQGAGYKDSTSKQKLPEEAPSAPRSEGLPDAPTWEHIGPQGTASFWARTEAPLPPLRPRCNFIHPKQLSPFPERLELPFPSEEILSSFEDIVSSSQDHYTTWVKTDPDCYLRTAYGRCSKSHCSFLRGIRKETRYIFSGILLQHKFA